MVQIQIFHCDYPSCDYWPICNCIHVNSNSNVTVCPFSNNKLSFPKIRVSNPSVIILGSFMFLHSRFSLFSFQIQTTTNTLNTKEKCDIGDSTNTKTFIFQLCVILEPMQELMSRHKAYALNPRDCLKTTLFQVKNNIIKKTIRNNEFVISFF